MSLALHDFYSLNELGHLFQTQVPVAYNVVHDSLASSV